MNGITKGTLELCRLEERDCGTKQPVVHSFILCFFSVYCICNMTFGWSYTIFIHFYWLDLASDKKLFPLAENKIFFSCLSYVTFICGSEL
jgi:hypothetical protein